MSSERKLREKNKKTKEEKDKGEIKGKDRKI
jgi:hypothetical protein